MFSRVDLPHNLPEAVRGEILDPSLLRMIATACDLSAEDMAGLQLVKSPESEMVELYQTGDGRRAFNVVGDRLRAYVEGRKDGHTREFMLAAMTNQSILHFALSDVDLRLLLIARPMLPEAWVKKTGSGTQTNLNPRGFYRFEDSGARATNTVSRWTSYCVVDGAVAWGYVLHFKPDDTLDFLEEMKCDARELDPKQAALFKEVDAEVETQMKKEGTYGRFGSLGVFWRLRKARLQERGMDWRSPGELNPNARYE